MGWEGTQKATFFIFAKRAFIIRIDAIPTSAVFLLSAIKRKTVTYLRVSRLVFVSV